MAGMTPQAMLLLISVMVLEVEPPVSNHHIPHISLIENGIYNPKRTQLLFKRTVNVNLPLRLHPLRGDYFKECPIFKPTI